MANKLKGKKAVSVALAAMIAATALVLPGCKKSTAGSTASGSGETVTVTWWMADTIQKDQSKVMDSLNELLVKKINVKLDMKVVDYGNYDQKMKVIISSGQPYDICFTCSWANNFTQQAYKGAYLAINDLLKKDGQGLTKLIPDSIWKSATINGNIYAVPTYKDSAFGAFYIFPKSLVEEAKFDYEKVTSLSDLTPYLAWVKKNHPSYTPYPLNGADGTLFDTMDQIVTDVPVTISLTDGSCTVINAYTDSGVMDKLRLLHQWYEKGYINKDAATATTYPKVRPLETSTGWPAAAAIWSTQQGYTCVVKQRCPLYLSTWSIQGSMNAISKNSKHPEAAMKLLNLVNTDAEVKNMLDYGIEGTHYQKTGDTSIKWISTNYQPGAFAQASFFSGLYTVDPAPTNEWTDLQKFEETAIDSPALGFMLNTNDSSIQTEETVLANIYKKYSKEIGSGSVDPDVYVPKMNAELDKAGLQDFIAKVQKQVDAWKASNQ